MSDAGQVFEELGPEALLDGRDEGEIPAWEGEVVELLAVALLLGEDPAERALELGVPRD